MEVALGTSDALTAQADLLAVGVFADLEPGPGAEPEMFVQFDVYGYALTGS